MLVLSVGLNRDWTHIIMPNGDLIRVKVNDHSTPRRVSLVFDAPIQYTILREKLDTERRRR